MTKDEYLEYLSEGVAMEGLKDVLNTPDFANKLLRSAGEVLIDLIDSIAANMIVLTNNLRGFSIYKESEEVMTLIVEKFDKIIDDCTYDFDKVIRGFSEKDIEKGVEIFEASTLTSKTATRIAIDEALKALSRYNNHVNNLSNQEKLDYKSSVELQRKMTALHRKINNLSKKIRISLKNLKVLEEYGMSKSYAEELLSVNKAEIARMGSILIAAFGNICVAPSSKSDNDSSEDLNISNRKIQVDVSRAKAMLNAV